MATGMTLPWLVLIPIKSTRIGKSRICLEPDRRRRLARAMALDTVTAVAAADRVGSVLVLADDRDDAAVLARIAGVRVHLTGVSGLNDVIREACALPEVTAAYPTRPVAVLPADLPSLRPAELDGALQSAEAAARAVVPDRQGTGTTLLTAGDATLLDPHYGPGSFAAHRVSGAIPLMVPDGSGLRCDVDTIGDLAGVRGRHTCRAAGDLASPQAHDREVG